MEIVLFILFATVGFVGLFFLITGIENENPHRSFFGLELTIIGFFLCGLVIGHKVYKTQSPTAIDVYRNKTTLEITYRDGIPVDSVVIFKEK